VSTQDSDAHELMLEALIEAYAPSTPGDVILVHLLANDLTQLKQVREMLDQLNRQSVVDDDPNSFFQLILTRPQALVTVKQILKRNAKDSPGCTRAEAVGLASILSNSVKSIETSLKSPPEPGKVACDGETHDMDDVSEAEKEDLEEEEKEFKSIWNKIAIYKAQFIDNEHLTAVLCGVVTPCAEERDSLQMLLLLWEESMEECISLEESMVQEHCVSLGRSPKLLSVSNKELTLEKAILQRIKLLRRALFNGADRPCEVLASIVELS